VTIVKEKVHLEDLPAGLNEHVSEECNDSLAGGMNGSL
jgi:hypothetical protein